MKCCGADRDTCFCPDCGARLTPDALVGLLAYLKRWQAASARRLDRAQARLEAAKRTADRALQARAERKVHATHTVASRWAAWVRAVESVLAERGNEQS
jgi:hypothetical protein